jgi:uncharacterized membrane protein YraQ (UPF0718 family)
VKWYAQEHVILCLIPAFFIAGAIGVFVSQASVMKYLGPKANKALAYGVASVSGTILAVCSCTVLPLFAGIWRMGAGLGPATAFLYSGPAINVLAIVLTARILGLELGIARAVGAIVFSIVIGLAMHFIYRKEEHAKAEAAAQMPEPDVKRPLWQTTFLFRRDDRDSGLCQLGQAGGRRRFLAHGLDAQVANHGRVQCRVWRRAREVDWAALVEGRAGRRAHDCARHPVAARTDAGVHCRFGGSIAHHQHQRRRSRRMVFRHLDVRKTDSTAVADRGAGGGTSCSDDPATKASFPTPGS